jgi:ADP-heptose:LPS heptosyltransferase
MTDKILIFSHGELIGDGMMKLPFLKAVRAAFPKATITWMAGRHPTIFNSALRELTAPYIDEVIDHTQLGDSLRDVYSKPWQQFLGARRFDYIFDTEHKRIPTWMLKRIPHGCFISASHSWFFADKKPPRGYKRPLMLRDRLLDLLEVATGVKPVVDVDMHIPAAWLAQADALYNTVGRDKPFVLLAPGAGGRFKCWPLENFIALAQKLESAGMQPLFILGPAEREWQATIQAAMPRAFFPLQMSQASSVYLTIALAAQANLCIANDGGVGHILASSNTPTISMWGPTDPLKSTPNGNNVHVVTAQEFGGNTMAAIPVDAIFESAKLYVQYPQQGQCGQSR